MGASIGGRVHDPARRACLRAASTVDACTHTCVRAGPKVHNLPTRMRRPWSIWGRSGVGLGSMLDRSGVGLAFSWGRFGVNIGSLWGRVGGGHLASTRGRSDHRRHTEGRPLSFPTPQGAHTERSHAPNPRRRSARARARRCKRWRRRPHNSRRRKCTRGGLVRCALRGARGPAYWGSRTPKTAPDPCHGSSEWAPTT